MTLKRADWAKLVAEWRGSHQSARQFAAARGVTDTALRYWAGRLADESDERGAPAGRTARRAERSASVSPPLARVIRPGEAPPAEGGGRIMVVVGQASIVVEPGFDGAHLRDVVRALSEAG